MKKIFRLSCLFSITGFNSSMSVFKQDYTRYDTGIMQQHDTTIEEPAAGFCYIKANVPLKYVYLSLYHVTKQSHFDTSVKLADLDMTERQTCRLKKPVLFLTDNSILLFKVSKTTNDSIIHQFD